MVKARLTDHVIKNFEPAKLFDDYAAKINSIDFSPDGRTLASAGNDEQIILYDCDAGKLEKVINSKKYGADLVTFTHSNNSVVHASTKLDDDIRHLSIHDKRYLRYFKGHTKKVISIGVSKRENVFASGSVDKTVRLWDLRSHSCYGMIYSPSSPVVAFDPSGATFAVGLNSEWIKLYDMRSYDKAPFITYKFHKIKGYEWSHIKYNQNGKGILVSGTGSVITLIDAYSGNVINSFTDFTTDKSSILEASFSPDGRYVLSGSADSKVIIWDTSDFKKVCEINVPEHYGPISCLKFNKKLMMFATACYRLVFWMPKPSSYLEPEPDTQWRSFNPYSA